METLMEPDYLPRLACILCTGSSSATLTSREGD